MNKYFLIFIVFIFTTLYSSVNLLEYHRNSSEKLINHDNIFIQKNSSINIETEHKSCSKKINYQYIILKNILFDEDINNLSINKDNDLKTQIYFMEYINYIFRLMFAPVYLIFSYIIMILVIKICTLVIDNARL